MFQDCRCDEIGLTNHHDPLEFGLPADDAPVETVVGEPPQAFQRSYAVFLVRRDSVLVHLNRVRKSIEHFNGFLISCRGVRIPLTIDHDELHRRNIHNGWGSLGKVELLQILFHIEYRHTDGLYNNRSVVASTSMVRCDCSVITIPFQTRERWVCRMKRIAMSHRESKQLYLGSERG
ncbi:hypothetical protein SDC9_158144 [bioreactor metagenome]|uniref:Uncharacterized protein n=1 Tax=bioreactor metagenome TaxID=1076179 RepID=A0A645F9D4_9ZZZZ